MNLPSAGGPMDGHSHISTWDRIIAFSPAIALLASTLALYTQFEVGRAVAQLRKEITEYSTQVYESRESAQLARANVLDRIAASQRERDNFAQQLSKIEERLRKIEIRLK